MKTLNNIFHEKLFEQLSCGWDGLCCYCQKAMYTELAHFINNTKANEKAIGAALLNAPILSTLPSCRDCNSGISNGYSRVPKRVSLYVVIAGRDALTEYYNQTSKLSKGQKQTLCCGEMLNV